MLNRVTITGADDGIDVRDLLAASARYPFVEWGILMSASRAGSPRYPSRRWMLQLESRAKMFVRTNPPRKPMQLSAHFCGEVARYAMRGLLHDLPVIERMQRIQINGWEPRADGSADVGVIDFARRMPSYDIILQVRDGDIVTAAHDAEAMGPRGSILYDPSGGTGRRESFKAWPLGCGRRRTVYVGYAGGLGPDNIAQVAEGFTEYLFENGIETDFWLDMESGVRDENNEFDMGKVYQVLERVRPYVRSA